MDNAGFSKADATWLNLTVPKGEPFYVAFDIQTTEDVSAWTFSFEAWKAANQETIFEFTDPDPAFQYNEGTAQLSLSLTPEQTGALMSTGVFLYHVIVRRPGDNSFILFRGRFIVEDWKRLN